MVLIPMAYVPQGELSPEAASFLQTFSQSSFFKTVRPEIGRFCAGMLTRNKEEPLQWTSSILAEEWVEAFAMATSFCHSRARKHVADPAIPMCEELCSIFRMIFRSHNERCRRIVS